MLDIQSIFADTFSIATIVQWHSLSLMPRQTRVLPSSYTRTGRVFGVRSQARFQTRRCGQIRTSTSSPSSAWTETLSLTITKYMTHGFSKIWLQKWIDNRIYQRAECDGKQRNKTKIVWYEICASYFVQDGHILDRKPTQHKHDSNYNEYLCELCFWRKIVFLIHCLPNRSCYFSLTPYTSLNLLKYFKVACEH